MEETFLDNAYEIKKWIEENKCTYLKNARLIKRWMESKNTTVPPKGSSFDKIEKKLGMALHRIRANLIKPYNNLKTEEEKEEYRRKHPELREVMEIINWVDGNRNELSELIKIDIKMTGVLKKATHLEKQYEGLDSTIEELQ